MCESAATLGEALDAVFSIGCFVAFPLATTSVEAVFPFGFVVFPLATTFLAFPLLHVRDGFFMVFFAWYAAVMAATVSSTLTRGAFSATAGAAAAGVGAVFCDCYRWGDAPRRPNGWGGAGSAVCPFCRTS